MNQFKRPLAWLLSLSMVASYIPPSYAQEQEVSGDNHLEIIENQVETQEYPLVIEDTSAEGETTSSDYTYEQFRKEFFADVENMDKQNYVANILDNVASDHLAEDCDNLCSLHFDMYSDYSINPDYVDGGVALQNYGMSTLSAENQFGFGASQKQSHIFRFDSTGSTTKVGTGMLIAQGEHVNIWIIDPDKAGAYTSTSGATTVKYTPVNSYYGQFVQFTTEGALVSSTSGTAKGTTAQMANLAEDADTIYKKMTQLIPHSSVVVDTGGYYSSLSQAGDVDKDGRVNMILYDFSGTAAGYFTGADFYNTSYLDCESIDAVHMNVTSAEISDSFLGTFAHELQHLLYFMYIGVFNGSIADSWINESLSGVPDMYYDNSTIPYDPNTTNTSTQDFNPGRMAIGTTNSYSNGSTYGDFLNFNNSSKNYGMSYALSALMVELEPEYFGRMYQQFRDNVSGLTFGQAVNFYKSQSIAQIYGACFQNVLKTRMPEVMDLSAEQLFEYVYYAFMESQISGGGDVILSDGTSVTTSEITKNPYNTIWSGKNGTRVRWAPNAYSASYDYPDEIASNGNVTLVGYPSNSSTIQATHEMGYTLVTTGYAADTENYLKINVAAPTSGTMKAYAVLYDTTKTYYTDSSGSINTNANMNEDHGDLYPLVLGQDNYIKVESADMKPFLYVTTYFNDVSSSVTYDWVSAPAQSAQDPLVLTDAELYHSLDLADITSGGSGSGAVSYNLTGADGIATLEDGILTLTSGVTSGTFTVSATKEGDDLYNDITEPVTATITVAVDSEVPVITISESYVDEDEILLKLSEVANWNPLTATAHDVVDGYLGQLEGVYTVDGTAEVTDLASARTYLAEEADRTVTITFTATDKANNSAAATVTLKSLANTAYAVTANANSGEFEEGATTAVWTVSESTLTQATLESLTIPTRQGYEFTGWYDDNSATTEITTKTVFTENTVIYAGWEAVKPTGLVYLVDGNYVDGNRIEIKEGDSFIITVEAENENGNNEVKWTYSNNYLTYCSFAWKEGNPSIAGVAKNGSTSVYLKATSSVDDTVVKVLYLDVVDEYTQPELPEIELDFGGDTFKPEEEDENDGKVEVLATEITDLFKALGETLGKVKENYGDATVKYYKHNDNKTKSISLQQDTDWTECNETEAQAELETADNQVKVEYTATVSGSETTVATFTLEAKADTEPPVIYLNGVAVTPDENYDPVDTITVEVNAIGGWTPPVATAVDNVDGDVDVSTIYGLVSGEEVNYENNTLNDLKESLKTVGNRGYISYSAEDSAGNIVEAIVLVISYEGIYVPDGLLKLVFDHEIHESGAEVSYSMSEFDSLIYAIRDLGSNIQDVDGGYEVTVSSWVENDFVKEEEFHDWQEDIIQLLLMANSKTKVEFTYNSEVLTYIFVAEDGHYRIYINDVVDVDAEDYTLYVGWKDEEDVDYSQVELALPNDTLKIIADGGDDYQLTKLTLTNEKGEVLLVNDDFTFTMPESDVWVTAIFVEPFIYLNYNYDGAPDDDKFELIGSGHLKTELTAASREGYEFDWWYHEPECLEYVVTYATFLSGDSIYAKWTPKTYTITFHHNLDSDTEESKATSEQIKDYDSKVTPPTLDNGVATLLGWYDNDQCTGTAVDFDSYIVTGEAEFYAKWSEAYDITFIMDIGNGDVTQDITTGRDGKLGEAYPVDPTHNNEDYSFVAWFTEKDGAGDKIDANTVFEESTTVYAHWSVDLTRTITLVSGDNGTVDTDTLDTDITGKLDFAQLDAVETTANAGYYFDGWFTDLSDENSQITEDTDFTVNSNVYAKWTAYIVVSLDLDGGTFGKSTVTLDKDGTIQNYSDFVATEPTKEDFYFNGWYQDEECTIPVTESSDLSQVSSLYVAWLDASSVFKITLTSNEGGSLNTEYLYTDTAGFLTMEQLTAVVKVPDTGYEFTGWLYQDGETSLDLSQAFDQDASILADWDLKTYTITFYHNDEDETETEETYSHFDTITPPTLEKDGYTLEGWFTEATFTTQWDFENPVTASLNLYAKWEEIPSVSSTYTITLDENHPDNQGGTTTEETDQNGYLSASQLSAPSTSPEGYAFVDWYDAKTEGAVVTATTLFTEDKTIYAIWEEIDDDENDPDDENTEGDDENTEGDDENTEGDDENAEGDDENTEGDDENAEGDDENTEGDDENAEGDDENAEGDDENAEGDDENAEGDDENAEGDDDAEEGVPEEYTLMGKVTDSTGLALEGITITVKRNGTTYETVTSNELGNYYLENTYSGYYYLIFDDGTTTKTVSINFSSDSTTLSTIAMPSHRISTEASISTRTMVQTVAGLDSLADLMAILEKTAVTLSIEILASTPSETQELIENVVGRDNEVAAFFEVAMFKRSYSEGEVVTEEEITEVETLLQIVIDIPEKYQDKENYYVYRLHNNDLDIISTSANSQNERIVLSEDGTTLTIYTRNFSTYAFVYEKDDVTSTGPSTGDTYPIIIERLADGEVSSSATVGTVGFSNSNPAAGALVTVTPYPGSGYQLDDVTVTTEDGSSLTVVDRGDGSYTFTQGSSIVTVTVAFISIDSIPTLYSLFSDVKVDDYYCDAINQVVEMGLMTGTTAHTFSPDKSLTRGMLVTILYKLSGNNSYGSGQFMDVYTTDYYYNAVAWAKELGIVSGYVDGTFRPGQNVTREELAVIFDSYCDKMNLASYVWLFPSQFVDNNVIGAWASNSVAFCTNLGILDSKEDYFYPSLHATRGEVAVSLLALSQL